MLAMQEEPGPRQQWGRPGRQTPLLQWGSGVGSVLGEVPGGGPSREQYIAVARLGPLWPQHPCPSVVGAPRSAQTCITLQLSLYFPAREVAFSEFLLGP